MYDLAAEFQSGGRLVGDIHLIMVAGLVARRISFFIFPFVASAKYPTSSHARVLRQPLRARSISLFISYKSAAGRMNGHNRSGEVGAPISSLSEKQQAELEVEKKFPISEDPIAFDNLKETLNRSVSRSLMKKSSLIGILTCLALIGTFPCVTYGYVTEKRR